MASNNPVIGTETCFVKRCRREVEVRVDRNGRCYFHCDGAASEDGEGCKATQKWPQRESREMKVDMGFPATLKGGVDGA